MAKCIKCGKSFLTRGRIKLADADICFNCFDSLGFDHKTGAYVGSTYKWDDIKDGFKAMMARKHAAEREKEAAEIGISPKHLKQLENCEATQMEIKIFATIYSVLKDEGRNTDVIDIDYDNNGALLLFKDGVNFIDYKADEGVKWIILLNESDEKIRIAGPARMNSLADRIIKSYDEA